MDNPIQKSNIIFVGCALADFIYKIQKNGPCSHKIALQMCHTTVALLSPASQRILPGWKQSLLNIRKSCITTISQYEYLN